MATAPQALSDLRSGVRRRAKVASDDTNSNTAIDGFINERYLRVSTSYKWRWLQKERDIRIFDEYTTGTVTVTADARTVTGSGTTWTDAFEDRYIKISGEDTYHRIVSRNSTTSIVLAERIERATASLLTYSIFQSDYGLWPDCEQVDEIWHDSSPTRVTVKPVGPREYSQLVSMRPDDSGKANVYTRYGYKPYDNVRIGDFVVGYDFVGAPETYKIALFPRVPDEDYTLHVRYIKKVTLLTDDTDTPLMPVEDRWILVYGALADYYGMQGDATMMDFWNKEYEKALRKMQGDQDDSDDRARMVVPGMWSMTRRPSPGRYDLGDYFDKWYERGN